MVICAAVTLLGKIAVDTEDDMPDNAVYGHQYRPAHRSSFGQPSLVVCAPHVLDVLVGVHGFVVRAGFT